MPKASRHNFDPDVYARDIGPLVKRLSERAQLIFALRCNSKVAHFYRVFDAGDLCVERAVRNTELWLLGKSTLEQLRDLRPKVDLALERALESYDATDRLNNIWNASPAGVTAYRAGEAARSAGDLLAAAMASAEVERNESSVVADYCVDAAAGALAATLFENDEVLRQCCLLHGEEP